jgi:hypothetical protein
MYASLPQAVLLHPAAHFAAALHAVAHFAAALHAVAQTQPRGGLSGLSV